MNLQAERTFALKLHTLLKSVPGEQIKPIGGAWVGPCRGRSRPGPELDRPPRSHSHRAPADLKIEQKTLVISHHQLRRLKIAPKKAAVDQFRQLIGLQKVRLLRHPCLLPKAKYPADFSNHQKTIPPAPFIETLGPGGCLKRWNQNEPSTQ